jgi:hypothetical protein
MKLLQSKNWTWFWTVETCHYFETWQWSQFSHPESVNPSIAYFYIVLHTNFCMESVPKNERKSSLAWKIQKIFCPMETKMKIKGQQFPLARSSTNSQNFLWIILYWKLYRITSTKYFTSYRARVPGPGVKTPKRPKLPNCQKLQRRGRKRFLDRVTAPRPGSDWNSEVQTRKHT